VISKQWNRERERPKIKERNIEARTEKERKESEESKEQRRK